MFLRKCCARLLFLAPKCLRGSNQKQQDDANFVQTVTSGVGGGVGLIWKKLKFIEHSRLMGGQRGHILHLKRSAKSDTQE